MKKMKGQCFPISDRLYAHIMFRHFKKILLKEKINLLTFNMEKKENLSELCKEEFRNSSDGFSCFLDLSNETLKSMLLQDPSIFFIYLFIYLFYFIFILLIFLFQKKKTKKKKNL